MNLNVLITVILFYVGWFGSVFLARTSYANLAILFPLILLAFLLFKKQLNSKLIFLAALISVIGVLFDSLLVSLNYVLIEGQTGWLIPLWLMSIWLLFTFSMVKLGPALRWPIWLASALGFIMGPLSYKSGEALRVLAFLTPWTFWVYAIFWAICFPLVLIYSKRFT